MGENSFWVFSLRFYGDPAVQEACLSLQDRYGGDVNLALYLIYRAAAGDVLSEDAVRALNQDTAGWRDAAVRPLRAIRRALKTEQLLADGTAQEALRGKIKAIELEAEKLQQLQLEAHPPGALRQAHPLEAARANLDSYGRVLGHALPGELVAIFTGRLAALS